MAVCYHSGEYNRINKARDACYTAIILSTTWSYARCQSGHGKSQTATVDDEATEGKALS